MNHFNKDKQRIFILYCIFAIISTILNIGSQEISTRLYQGSAHLIIAIIIGTGVGLISKYILDKRYIFHYKTNNLEHNSRIFFIYCVMGGFTTLIFWGFEFLFDYLFDSKSMRYVGACIGLAIGYTVKYLLDKRYVFK